MRLALTAIATIALLLTCGPRAAQQPTTSGDDALAALERDPLAVVQRGTASVYKATYLMSFTTSLPVPAASALPSFAITQTFASRPPDARWDTALDLAGSSFTGPSPSRIVGVVRGTAGYICIDVPTPAACYGVSAEQTRSFDVRSLTAALDQVKALGSDVEALTLPRERIAGRDGACFRFTPKRTVGAPAAGVFVDTLTVETCFTADGIPLRMGWSAGGLMAIEQRATSVSDTVTDADLGLPYPVSSTPFPFGETMPRATPTTR